MPATHHSIIPARGAPVAWWVVLFSFSVLGAVVANLTALIAYSIERLIARRH